MHSRPARRVVALSLCDECKRGGRHAGAPAYAQKEAPESGPRVARSRRLPGVSCLICLARSLCLHAGAQGSHAIWSGQKHKSQSVRAAESSDRAGAPDWADAHPGSRPRRAGSERLLRRRCSRAPGAGETANAIVRKMRAFRAERLRRPMCGDARPVMSAGAVEPGRALLRLLTRGSVGPTAGLVGGCRTNQTGCTNLTTADFADPVRAAQAGRAGPPRRKWFTPESLPCRRRTKSRDTRWFVRQPRRIGEAGRRQTGRLVVVQSWLCGQGPRTRVGVPASLSVVG